jgi:triacylglycerol lipase
MTPRDYALLAQAAYDDPPDIGKADSASRAIVRQTACGLVVAFRGSDDLDSWIHNLDAVPVSVPGMGDVHRGFYQAWQAIADQVIAAIGDKPVTLTGHSLGAVLSIFAAASLTLIGKPPVAVFAFEPPRASFDLTLRNLLAKVPLHLWRHGLDLVTNLAPGGMHPGLLTRFGKPSVPWPNITDHLMPGILADLPQA